MDLQWESYGLPNNQILEKAERPATEPLVVLKDTSAWIGWRPYLEPIPYEEGNDYEFKAHRIGFMVSKSIIYKNEK